MGGGRRSWLVLLTFLLAPVLAPSLALADLYSYVNDDGDYVISKQKPERVGDYVVLSDEGKFIERVQSPRLDVPITHWRPWYLPQEPDPFGDPDPERLPEPDVSIEEVDARGGSPE